MKLSDKQIELLKTIKAKIVRGDIRVISESVKLTREYVGNVLNPDTETFNDKVVDKAVEIISKREQTREKHLQILAD